MGFTFFGKGGEEAALAQCHLTDLPGDSGHARALSS